MIKGHPCRVINALISKPGKHGSTKLNVTGLCQHCDKKFNMAGLPGHSSGTCPEIVKFELAVANIDLDHFSLLTEAGDLYEEMEFDMHGPHSSEHSTIADQFEEAQNQNKDCFVTMTRMPLEEQKNKARLFERLVFAKIE